MGTHAAARRYRAEVRYRRPVAPVQQERPVALLAPSTQEALDCITYLAGEALEVAAVCASLVDKERRRLLASSYGLPVPTALLISRAFQKQVVATGQRLVVTDGPVDPLVALNPAVRDGTVRSCVAMPLGTADGHAVGILLAMDHKPRQWTAQQLDLLGKLSALIVSEIELATAQESSQRVTR
jgi:GAF domain-containing protein